MHLFQQKLPAPAFSLLFVAGSEMLRLRLGLAVGLDVFIGAAAVILALGGPLMIGILLGEGVCAVRICREAARWRTRAISS